MDGRGTRAQREIPIDVVVGHDDRREARRYQNQMEACLLAAVFLTGLTQPCAASAPPLPPDAAVSSSPSAQSSSLSSLLLS